jgi:hypothetical protein
MNELLKSENTYIDLFENGWLVMLLKVAFYYRWIEWTEQVIEYERKIKTKVFGVTEGRDLI